MLINLRFAPSLRQHAIHVPIDMTLRRMIIPSQVCAPARAETNSPIKPARMSTAYDAATRYLRGTVLAMERRKLIFGNSTHHRFLMNSVMTLWAVSRLAFTGSAPNLPHSGNSQVAPCCGAISASDGWSIGGKVAGGRVGAH